ncbi:MAG: hypothetical protein HYT87_17550 [Nitrospirae bacterium]|nr:hypothetical protein [Nitrospirota bacterium]
MPAKPSALNSPLLADANIVIVAYDISVWEQLIARHKIVVPGTVIDDEALFYSTDQAAVPSPINLQELVNQGKIERVDATASEIGALKKSFNDVFLQSLDPGETEALAVIGWQTRWMQILGSGAPFLCSLVEWLRWRQSSLAVV